MSIKRTIIVTAAIAASVAMVAPTFAGAVTVEELLAQIAALQAQLLALQGQSTGGTGATGACVGVSFTRNLTVGSTGSDVKCLQQTLNVTPQSGYFGPITLAAVKAYQTEKGWTPANQVGPMTRAALNAQLASTPSTPVTPGTTGGSEGSIAVTASVSPVTGGDVYVGRTNTAIAGLDVKATGSNVTVNRVDVNFTASTGTSCNLRPWTNISGITVSDGTTSKSAAVTQSSVIENTVGSSYTARVEGINIVVPKDTTKKLTVSVDTMNSLPVGATACVPAYNFAVNSVRATDGAGVSQYGPSTAISRTFNVTTGDTGTLTVSVSTANPLARNIVVQETSSTDNVTLLKFNVEAKSNDVILRTVVAELLASDTLNLVVPTVKLLDGSTELASTSTAAATGATTTFSELTLRIPKGTTKSFTIVGQLAQTTSHYAEGQTVDAKLYAASVSGEDASTYATVTAGGSDVTAGQAILYLKAPTFALVSKSITAVTPTSGSTVQAYDATLAFNVTATGGDIYIKKLSATAASSGIHASSTDSGASGEVSYTFSTNATEGTNAWRVSNGETKTFTVSGVLSETTQTAATYYVGYFAAMGIANVKWSTADEDADATVTQTWGIDDLKTDERYLNPVN